MVDMRFHISVSAMEERLVGPSLASATPKKCSVFKTWSVCEFLMIS
jgi:hypothetical protein